MRGGGGGGGGVLGESLGGTRGNGAGPRIPPDIKKLSKNPLRISILSSGKMKNEKFKV